MKPVFKNKVNNCIKKPFLSTEFFNKEKSKQFQDTQYFMLKKSCPILHSNLLYELGKDILGTQHVQLFTYLIGMDKTS